MIEQIVSVNRVQMDAAELAMYTDFACELADTAAEVILPHFRTAVLVEDKGRDTVSAAAGSAGSSAYEFDPVTIADKKAEMVMREKICNTFPHHGVLGEEHGLHIGESGLTWVLDPIDGTRAFITGLPLWGCLISLFDGVEPVLGVMDQPYMRERYIGTGRSAHCIESDVRSDSAAIESRMPNDAVISQTGGLQSTPLQTRKCKHLGDAVMMTTSPTMFKSEPETIAFNKLANDVRMQRFGGDCYAYCMLARGFVDLVVEADLQPYDIQALIPVVRGAGGVISNWRGDSAIAGGQVIASATAELHEQALAVLRSAA